MHLYFIFLSLFLVSCASKPQTPASVLKKATEDNESVFFREVNSSVFKKSCLSCHDASDRLPLNTYVAVSKNLENIKLVVSNGSMPKAPTLPLTESEKSLVLNWIENGAPEFAPEEIPPEPTPVLEAKFTSIRRLIFETRCDSCHALSGVVAIKVPLDFRALIESPRELIVPENAEESGLMIAITRQDDKRMPPPKSGAPLSQEELTAIQKWINDGAKSN